MPRSRKSRRDDRDYYELKKRLKKLVKKRPSRSRSRSRRHYRRQRDSSPQSQESLWDRDRSLSAHSGRERLRSERERRERSSRSARRYRRRSRSRYSSRDKRSQYILSSLSQSETEDVVDVVDEHSISAAPIDAVNLPQHNDTSGNASVIHSDTAAAAAAPSTEVVATQIDDPTPAAFTSADVIVEPIVADVELDSSILEIFGEDPTQTNVYGSEIQKDLAVRLEHAAINGLRKETKKELKDKYLIPINCKLIDAPVLNPEIKVAVSDIVSKRDKAIEAKQKQVACAISCLSQAITRAVSAKEKDTELIKLLMNGVQLLCDTQHSDSVTRRSFIVTSVKKDMKEQLDNTKPDNFLFGQNLAETLKTAKAINKSGAELKVSAGPKSVVAKKLPPRPGPSKALNSRGPPARRPAGPPRTKEPATQSSQQPRYSRPSQRQQQHYRR